MKEYTKAIGYITVFSFISIAAVSYYMFHDMNTSLLRHQQEQFQTESESKITILQDRIDNIAKRFKSYTQLPSFKSIRFNSLTLNHFAVAEDIRQLELFLFDMQKNNEHLQSIRFVDNEGKELIKVDRGEIYAELGHFPGYKKTSSILSLNLKDDEFHVYVIHNDSGKPESLIWWMPVYVSLEKRLGYMVFDVDVNLIKKEMIDIHESGLNLIVITSEQDDITKGKYQLASEEFSNNIKFQKDKWIVSKNLSLSGLDWKIHIVGDKSAYIVGINATQSLVDFGLVPATIFILITILYVYRKKLESDKHIHHLAYYDSLTGLVNRHQFDSTLNNALLETQEHDAHHALLYLDLDQFKIVNDTCGHLAGDKLLEELAAHLKKSVRDSDMLARLGGDEFALLLNLCPEEKAISIANKILTTVSEFHFVWKDKSFTVGVSIGVVFITSPDESANNVLRKADLACYMAKELGRNRIHVYTDDDQSLEKRHGEMQWVNRINQALDEDLFYLVVQRILPLHDEEIPQQRYEVLIRLNENGKMFLPDAFIPAAERYGLMPSIDKWVIENTLSFMEKLQNSPSEENRDIIFSINISGVTLGSKDLYPYIKEKLSLHKISPESICFEITETAAISNLSIAMEFIHSIKSLGCSLALDDFGSGLCSFSYLKTIPVDYLKIDGSFITRMLDNPLDMAIVVAIREISHATKSRVIAEYVSSTEIKEKLQALGIHYAQGYGIAKPVPINTLFKLVDVNAPNSQASNY